MEEPTPIKRSQVPFQTEGFRCSRPKIVGPQEPQTPFPIKLVGLVQKGFGRGGKDLGCPTANLPDDSIEEMTAVAETGVYYGYAQVIPPSDEAMEFGKEELVVLPMEIHIMHSFSRDFYGYEMRAIVLGYIRPELNYTSREALIDDINTDKHVALQSLERPGYHQYAKDSHFNELE